MCILPGRNPLYHQNVYIKLGLYPHRYPFQLKLQKKKVKKIPQTKKITYVHFCKQRGGSSPPWWFFVFNGWHFLDGKEPTFLARPFQSAISESRLTFFSFMLVGFFTVVKNWKLWIPVGNFGKNSAHYLLHPSRKTPLAPTLHVSKSI